MSAWDTISQEGGAKADSNPILRLGPDLGLQRDIFVSIFAAKFMTFWPQNVGAIGTY